MFASHCNLHPPAFQNPFNLRFIGLRLDYLAVQADLFAENPSMAVDTAAAEWPGSLEGHVWACQLQQNNSHQIIG